MEVEKMFCTREIDSGGLNGLGQFLLGWKEDGLLHFWVKYKKLNGMIVWDSYPVTSMDNCIHFLRGAKLLQKLNASTLCQVVKAV